MYITVASNIWLDRCVEVCYPEGKKRIYAVDKFVLTIMRSAGVAFKCVLVCIDINLYGIYIYIYILRMSTKNV